MNPFTIPLIAIPVVITLYASFVNGRWARLGLLLVATMVFWIFLQVVLVIAPVYWSSKGIQWIWSKIRN